MQYTNLINKEVVSIYDGASVGKTMFGIFGKQKLLILVVNDAGSQKILDVKNIFSCQHDKIMIKNKNALVVSQNDNINSFSQKEVISVFGENFGMVGEIMLDEKFVVTKIKTDKTEFLLSNIVSNNEKIIINNNSSYKNFQFAPKKKIEIAKNLSQKVQITTKIPIKITSGSFLIGKKLFRDIITPSNITLARKNQIVTLNLVNLAKDNGCLNLLINSIL